MDNKEMNSEIEHHILKAQKGKKRGKVAGGLVIMTFGVLFLLKRLHYNIPEYLFHWESILIGLGFVVLVKNKFARLHGYLMIAVGFIFHFANWYPNLMNKDLILPSIIILIGLLFMFSNKKKKSKCRNNRHRFKDFKEKRYDFDRYSDLNEGDFIDAVSVFGHAKKTAVTKNFKGGDIVAIFGGAEINLAQADFEGRVVFDVTNFFGGTSMIIPSNWQVITEMVTIFGGFEDKRPEHQIMQENDAKILVIRGTTVFGGIEINSI